MASSRWVAVAVLLSPLLMGFALPGRVERLCARGSKLYEAEKYQEAAAAYERALKLRSHDATLLYNHGTALYQAGQLQAAQQALAAAMAQAPQDLQQDLHYNIGNTRYRLGDFKGAIEQYKQALRLDPDDAQAKYNLEMSQRKLNEQEKQQDQQEQSEKDKAGRKPSKEEQQQGQQQEKEAEEQEAERKQAQAQESQEDESEKDSDKEGQPLSKEQAAALLRALAAEDAALQRIIRRVPSEKPREVDKDW